MLFQILQHIAADLHQRNLAKLGVVLRREDTLLGIQKALLRLTHLNTGQVTEQAIIMPLLYYPLLVLCE